MTSAPTTPLRQRMIEDMTIRQFGPKTQQDYVRVVADFARFLGRSPKPDRASVTLKKNRRADTAAFILAGEAPSAARCSWYRRRSSGSAWSGERPRNRAKSATTRT